MDIPLQQTAIIITAPGGPEALRCARMAVPVPTADEVLIEVVAAGVNRHDCNQRKAGPAHEPNPVPGLEVSGRIVVCGDAVPTNRLGEEVVALTDGGGYAEYVTAPAALALPRAGGLDWVEAAALPEALFTIWLNFKELMRLSSGEHAFIHGGTSGVGSIGIQILAALGHKVFASAGTDAKRQAAVAFGAAAAFDYNDVGMAHAVLEATGDRGVDCILDMSAGAHLQSDLRMLAPGGRISFLSAGGGKEISVPLRSLMAKRIHITGAFLRALPVAQKIAIASELREGVWPLLSRVRPRIEGVYPLAQAEEAHRRMEANSHIGKIMLAVRDK
ncbi:NAD(P)H-quinone oxidoreductase [Tardiphaga sp. 604_B6_N1_1]|uniref:NAD(P)H-quinone oxidoreductase n=1 Tax=unclassified Tardiphaga TaxID=2631404 RepID=UPI003F20E7F4